MKTEKFSGKIGNAYGNKLPKEIPFNGTYEAFEKPEEVRAANKWPSDSDIVDYVNSLEKNNERQKAMTAALDAAGIAKPDPNDPAVVTARMIKDIDKLDLPQDQKDMLRAVLQSKLSTPAEEPATV